MTRTLRACAACGAVLLAAGAASAAGMEDVLRQALGREVEFNGSVLLALFVAILPVGMIGAWIAARMLVTDPEDLGGKVFVVAFFHRLMFTVGFWCVALMGLHESAALPPQGIVFLTSLAVAMLAFRFSISEPMGRILLMAVTFCLLDSVLMSIVLVGSLAAFG